MDRQYWHILLPRARQLGQRKLDELTMHGFLILLQFAIAVVMVASHFDNSFPIDLFLGGVAFIVGYVGLFSYYLLQAPASLHAEQDGIVTRLNREVQRLSLIESAESYCFVNLRELLKTRPISVRFYDLWKTEAAITVDIDVLFIAPFTLEGSRFDGNMMIDGQVCLTPPTTERFSLAYNGGHSTISVKQPLSSETAANLRDKVANNEKISFGLDRLFWDGTVPLSNGNRQVPRNMPIEATIDVNTEGIDQNNGTANYGAWVLRG